MKTINILIAIVAVTIFSLINATGAFADTRTDNRSVSGFNKGYSYMVETFQAKERDGKSCTPATDAPTLDQYLDNENAGTSSDPAYTPVDVAYGDYLSDLQGFVDSNPGICTITPETLN